jgi:phage antirepressor YoqD-like protein
VVIQKMQSFLDLFVMVRLIRAETKDWIINTVTEGSALLPAVPTLLMPSYFTQFGVIYVSLIVPAGYSISSCNSKQNPTRNNTIEIMMPKMEDASRYLQFWMVHAAVSALITSFAPILAWIPLSTHVTWLLWAYVQLQSSTRKIMSWFESELGKKSLGETVIVQSIRKIIAALPSDVNQNSDSGVVEGDLAASGEKRKSD